MPFGRGSHLEFPFPVAVKTGPRRPTTTTGPSVTPGRHCWRMGGNFDRTPLRQLVVRHRPGRSSTGHGRGHARGARRRARTTSSRRRTMSRGDDLRALRIDPTRVPVAQEGMDDRGEDPVPCAWHHRSDEGVRTIYPPEYRAWAATAGVRPVSADAGRLQGTASAVPSRGTLKGRPASDTVSQRHRHPVANPPRERSTASSPTLRREFQRCRFASSPAPPPRDLARQRHADWNGVIGEEPVLAARGGWRIKSSARRRGPARDDLGDRQVFDPLKGRPQVVSTAQLCLAVVGPPSAVPSADDVGHGFSCVFGCRARLSAVPSARRCRARLQLCLAVVGHGFSRPFRATM